MRPYDGQSDVRESLEQRLAHPALDAESLGRMVLMLEWFVTSGLVHERCAARLLAERVVEARGAALPSHPAAQGTTAPHDIAEVGGWISLAEAERIVLAMMAPPEAAP